jgi:isoquinoline 1-oxidoreductase subunit beta
MHMKIRRRQLLGGAAATLSVAFLPGCAGIPVIPKRPSPDARAGLSWISHQSGSYVLTLPRVEMGQNISTALKQIACDELGIDPQQLQVKFHNTDRIERVRASVGSESIMDFALPLARACATLRQALVNGQTSGKLEAIEFPREKLHAFSSQAQWVGHSPPLTQGLEIVTGQPLFASDIRLPGMVFGRVLRAPVPPEVQSQVTELNELAAKKISGFIAIVRNKLLQMSSSEGVGIVAQTPGALDRIEQALNVQWRVEGNADAKVINQSIDIDRRLSNSRKRDKYIRKDAISDGKWDVDLRFDVPIASHAAIEPRVAVAQPTQAGGLNMWVGSQDVFYQRDVICRRLGIAEERVKVQGCRVGGAFGGKTIATVELEAAVLAHELKLPVKVQWTRSQEFMQAFQRPPSSHRVRVRLNKGRLADWSHDFASSHILFTGAVLPAWMQKITDVIGDDGVARGAELPYEAKTVRTGFDLVRLPVHTGPWRGLGAGPNVFVIESAIDECARSAGADPLSFRLAHIKVPRLRRVLEEAVATAPVIPSSVSGKLIGRGIACGIYKKTSFAAVVADVEVDQNSGEVKVLQMHCAHDCGKVVNPDQVRAQCEGNMVWGLGMVLVENWTQDVRNFGESPIPRITQLPSLSVHLVNHDEAPSGAGETAIVASGAAIANAIRSATGWRLSKLPVKPAEILAHFNAKK